MEDSYYGDYQKGFFAVYDGHGGARCSGYAAQNLHELIFKVRTSNTGRGVRGARVDCGHLSLASRNLVVLAS